MLVERVTRLLKQHAFWQPTQRVLVAVSTGVDSMVLLHILQQMNISIGVVHVNHRLREASEQEAVFLTAYCEENQLPLYKATWDNPALTNVEAAARTFRYTFFEEVMRLHHYEVLVTAHHADDQMETILMKLARDGNFFNSQGIRWSQAFGNGTLVRPLLTTTKAEIRAYSEQHQIVSYEDETNTSLAIQRNRWRQQILPFIKAENQQANQHFQQWSEQMTYAQEMIQEQQNQWYQQLLTEQSQAWAFELKTYHTLTTAQQYFFIQGIGQRKLPVALSERQIRAIMHMLQQADAQQAVDLAQNWECRKTYQTVRFQRKKEWPQQQDMPLTLGEGLYVSDEEWVGFFRMDQEIPEKVKDWSEYRQKLSIDCTERLLLRRRKPGDRLSLTPKLTKKVNRWFIDQKIPQLDRERAWVVTDNQENILGILPYIFSYLSIVKETDKIHYILLYRRKKDRGE